MLSKIDVQSLVVRIYPCNLETKMLMLYMILLS